MAKTPVRSKSQTKKAYVHGYSPVEQARLVRQAELLENQIHAEVDLSRARRLLEVGCGVGAQTEILLRRYPELEIVGVDASEAQIEVAKKRLAPAIREGRVTLMVGDVFKLPFQEDEFDSAFICWVLEHLQEPVAALKEVRRVLRAKSVLYCSEVLNAAFYLHPYSPATLKYLFEFNDHQWNMKGDPFVGGKVANYLLKAGYQNISTRTRVSHYDNRAPKGRALFIDYWMRLLLSAAPELLKVGKVTPDLVEEMKAEMERLKGDPESVIYDCFVQARAEVL